MPPSTQSAVPDVELSVEEATLSSWVEEKGVYLSLEPAERDPRTTEPPQPDQS